MPALYHYSSDAEIIRIGEGFLDLSLPEHEWTHGAHWAAAFWLILTRPDLNPERDMPDLIRRFNEAKGGQNTDTTGYHETITQASLIIARAHLAAQTDIQPLHEICNRLYASRFGKSDWLLAHWTKQLLFSATARKEWIAPDIAPLTLQAPMA